MTDIQVKEQIKTIERATAKALRSKVSAVKFLTEAGIIKNSPKKNLDKKD